MLTSPSFTRRKSGIVFISAAWNGTQSSQQLVDVQLFRDYGTSGQTLLADWETAPGGISPFPWSDHSHSDDELADDNAHTYSLVATPSGGSQLSAGAGQLKIVVFEIGSPA